MKICSKRRSRIIKSPCKRISLSWELMKIQYRMLTNRRKVRRTPSMRSLQRNSQNYKESWELTLSWSLKLKSLRVLLTLSHLVIGTLKTRTEWPKSLRRSRIVKSRDNSWTGLSTKRRRMLIEPKSSLVEMPTGRTTLTWMRRKSTKLKWREIDVRKISNRVLIHLS